MLARRISPRALIISEYPEENNAFQLTLNADALIAEKNLQLLFITGIRTSGPPAPAVMENILARYKLLAEKNNARAYCNLAWLYDEGIAEPSLNQAERDEKVTAYYRKAIALQNTTAMNNLGVKILNAGDANSPPTKDNIELAVSYFKMGMQHGDAVSAFHLGEVYESGLADSRLSSQEQDRLAENCYKNATRKGELNAALRLGRMYLRRRAGLSMQSGERDQAAFNLFKEAAKENNRSALFLLGWQYANHRTGLPNIVLSTTLDNAVYYLTQAALLGKKRAMSELIKLYQLQTTNLSKQLILEMACCAAKTLKMLSNSIELLNEIQRQHPESPEINYWHSTLLTSHQRKFEISELIKRHPYAITNCLLNDHSLEFTDKNTFLDEIHTLTKGVALKRRTQLNLFNTNRNYYFSLLPKDIMNMTITMTLEPNKR